MNRTHCQIIMFKLVQSNLDIKVTQLDSEVILILNMGTEASWERGKLLCRSHVILTAMHIKQVYHV